MSFPKYTGNFLGIVVQNNDPAKRGRIKVFVPHISPTVYKNWTELSKDKKFKFMGANICSDLTDILEDLKTILPWAEIAAPLAGESASGRYNAFLNTATISDSNNPNTAFNNLSACTIDNSELTREHQNLDSIGEKPGNVYDISYYKLKDAFADPEDTQANNANVYSYNYTPECYSNCAKGAFPLLRVGSHVWVFFNEGDPLKPVVFAVSFGSDDWKGIHDIPYTDNISLSSITNDEGIDYPGTYENISQKYITDRDINTDTYRNKYVINQKGGTISFVNTDNKEVLKLTHYSGSFKEFNNSVNIELATNNDQKLVLGDQFLTVRGTRNEFTQFDYDTIVQGDWYKKIGKQNKEAHQAWKNIVSKVAEIKGLFDINRTELGGVQDRCPVCNSDTNSYWNVNNSFDPLFRNLTKETISIDKGDLMWSSTLTDNGWAESVLFPGNNGQPWHGTAIDDLGGTVDNSSAVNGPGRIFGVICKACGGTGLSPSSQGGKWIPNPSKLAATAIINGKIKELAAIEKEIGLGGSEIIDITKNKVETIGLVMNDFSPIRIDTKGKMYISDVVVAPYGTYFNRTPTPLVEKVHVDDLPGGSYTLNVCNKYNVLVGAGGMSLKSYGIVNISGAMTNIAGAQINIGSDHEINIDGGKRVNIVGDVVSIRQRDNKQIVNQGDLGVTGSAFVAGGLHVEGEVTVNHITAPAQVIQTGPHRAYAAPATDATNGNGPIAGFGYPLSNLPIRKSDGIRFEVGVPGAPAYIGTTDTNRIIGLISSLGIPGVGSLPIGYIPREAVATYNPLYGGGVNETGGPLPNSLPIPIYGGIPIGLPLALNEEPFAIPSGTVFGTGIPSIRGCYGPTLGLDGVLVNYPILNASAETMPIVIYGTGADPNCIMTYPHTHSVRTIASTLTETNFQTRLSQKAYADPVINAPQDPPSDSMLATLAQNALESAS